MSSKEVDTAVGAAPGRLNKTAELERRAAELRRVVEQPSPQQLAAAELAEIERQLAEAREAEGRQQAERRALGISKAIGSVVAELEDDDERLFQAAQAFAAAADRLNDRYGRYESLAAEDAALRDRFGIRGAKIPTVVPPNERPGVVAAVRKIEGTPYATYHAVKPAVESCEHGLRIRRTYAEIANTPSAEIIAQAGLKPFPPLTARQQDEVASAEAERKRTATPDPFLARETEVSAALPPEVSAMSAGVHRG
jgi:hypothetical protein